MAAWDRDTPWRQGHVLTSESSVALGLVPADHAESAFTVVISHDCDLAQSPEAEPLVEVILAKRIGAPNGNFTHAKNSRRRHWCPEFLGCYSRIRREPGRCEHADQCVATGPGC